MKKLLAIMLAALMLLSFAACGKDKDKDDDSDKAKSSTKVEEYVDKNEDLLVSAIESSLIGSNSGITCTSSVEADGNGIIVKLNIDQLDDVDESVKEQMQVRCDMMKDQLSYIVSGMRSELPELEYLEYRICEEDGDFVANLVLE